MIIIIHYGDPVDTVNPIYKSPNIKLFFKHNFGPTTKFNSCQCFLLYSMCMFDMVSQAQNGVLSLEQLKWPASQPAGWVCRTFCVAMWMLMGAVYGSLMHGECRLSARDKFTPT